MASEVMSWEWKALVALTGLALAAVAIMPTRVRSLIDGALSRTRAAGQCGMPWSLPTHICARMMAALTAVAEYLDAATASMCMFKAVLPLL
jgi:hypothetical protein